MIGQSWPLRRRARLVYAVSALFVVFGFTFAAVSFDQFVHARTRFGDRLDPAALATERWLNAAVNQETAIRSYALTDDDAYLRRYRSAQRRGIAWESYIRHKLTGILDVDPVSGMASALDRWRTDSVGPLMSQPRRSGASSVPVANLEASLANFDVVRQRYQDLAATIDQARTHARDNLDHRVRLLAITAGSALALVIAGLLATWLFLQRLILAPLGELGDDARQVASGALDHQVATTGPPEIAALAGDVEAMRSRIRDELAAVTTASEQLEQQRADLARSNEELEQFAYVASHDLQEPLRKITGFSQLLQRRYEGQIDERADEYIAFAVDGAKRMQVLINDLLTFSRVGRTTESFAPIDLAHSAQSAIDSLAQVITDADAVVEVGPLPTVPGDATLLEALVMNLIANAVKFRNADPPRITLSARSIDDVWELTCADNGIGIGPAYAERVFEIFQRLHGRDAYEGTGIGLAMCRKIVEFHGGRIWIDIDAPGPGATIRWTLPAQAATIPSPSGVQKPDLALAGDQP